MTAQPRSVLLRAGAAVTLAGALALGATAARPAHAAPVHRADAAASRVLRLSDFFNVYPGEVEDVSGTAKATVAGVSYAHAIELDRGIASLSYNTHRYPGYSSLQFLVGLTDSSDAGSQDTLVVSTDGRQIKSITANPGSPAVKVVLHLGKTSIFRFSVKGDDPASSGLLIAQPMLAGGSSGPVGTAALRLKDFFNVYPGEVEDVSGTAKATVAGIRYARAIELDRGIGALSYNTHKHAGYNGISFLVGMTDSSDAGSQNTLVVSADGRPIKTLTAPAGSPAVKVVIRFGQIKILRFGVKGNDPASSGLLILNPKLVR